VDDVNIRASSSKTRSPGFGMVAARVVITATNLKWRIAALK
jgi:hypothetical protein